jgi:heme/copper-type cytochrome/quinol oxidase subunit 2
MLTERLGETAADGQNMLVLALFGLYFAFLITFIIAGIALAVKKLTRFKVYKKQIANDVFTEISSKRKTVIFFTTIPGLIMILLTVDRFAGGFIAHKLYEVLILAN